MISLGCMTRTASGERRSLPLRAILAPDEAVQSFRIALSVATRRTLAAALTLLGVSSPEQM